MAIINVMNLLDILLFVTMYEYYNKQYIFIIFLQDTEYGRKRGSCSVVNFRTFESFRF